MEINRRDLKDGGMHSQGKGIYREYREEALR